MAPNMKYWDDWVDVEDMQAMWGNPDVCAEWIAAGEKQGHKVHMLRNSDGQPYVTQTEMRAMAEIVINRHFNGKLNPVMICAIAEVESDRQPLTYHFDSKLREAKTGLMQVLQSTAEWLAKEKGYRHYKVDWSGPVMYRPFVSVYFGAAYLRWLSTYTGKSQNEEFIVRSYCGGTKKASNKSTLSYWNRYLMAKQSLPENSSRSMEGQNVKHGPLLQAVTSATETKKSAGKRWVYWDEKVLPEDMDEMWRRHDVKTEWMKSGEQVGKVRFARDSDLRPYLTRTEIKAVADIILAWHFKQGRINSEMLCALAEICSKRLLYGLDFPNGILHIAFPTAEWLHNTLGYKAYKIQSGEDLSNPFLSMYFAACYLSWLSTYEGRQRNDQFIVKAYLVGPQNVNDQMAGSLWLKYLAAVTHYHQKQRKNKACIIL